VSGGDWRDTARRLDRHLIGQTAGCRFGVTLFSCGMVSIDVYGNLVKRDASQTCRRGSFGATAR
jgi:hypothetical protein